MRKKLIAGAVMLLVAAWSMLVTPVSASAAAGTPRLNRGERLSAGQSLTSPSGLLTLAMQTDGNLVLYAPGNSARWHTQTHGNPGAFVQLQSDGNLVLYAADLTVLRNWATHGTDAAFLQVQDDGNLVLYTSTATPLWNTGTRYFPSRINAPGTLRLGQGLQSPSGVYELMMQADGNLVLYKNAVAQWSTVTNGIDVTGLAVQADGNLVLYRASGGYAWAANSGGLNGGFFQVQDDGVVVFYSPTSTPIWVAAAAGGVLNGNRPGGSAGGVDGPMPAGWSSANPTASWACSGVNCVDYSGYDRARHWNQDLCSNGHNCTNYVAYRLERRGVQPFVTQCHTGANAQSWDERARNCGLAVDGNPTPGSVLQWDGNASMPNGGSYSSAGHVAYVDAVFGDVLLVSQSSYSSCSSSRVVLSIASLRAQGMRQGGSIEVIHP